MEMERKRGREGGRSSPLHGGRELLPLVVSVVVVVVCSMKKKKKKKKDLTSDEFNGLSDVLDVFGSANFRAQKLYEPAFLENLKGAGRGFDSDMKMLLDDILGNPWDHDTNLKSPRPAANIMNKLRESIADSIESGSSVWRDGIIGKGPPGKNILHYPLLLYLFFFFLC